MNCYERRDAQPSEIDGRTLNLVVERDEREGVQRPLPRRGGQLAGAGFETATFGLWACNDHSAWWCLVSFHAIYLVFRDFEVVLGGA